MCWRRFVSGWHRPTRQRDPSTSINWLPATSFLPVAVGRNVAAVIYARRRKVTRHSGVVAREKDYIRVAVGPYRVYELPSNELEDLAPTRASGPAVPC